MKHTIIIYLGLASVLPTKITASPVGSTTFTPTTTNRNLDNCLVGGETCNIVIPGHSSCYNCCNGFTSSRDKFHLFAGVCNHDENDRNLEGQDACADFDNGNPRLCPRREVQPGAVCGPRREGISCSYGGDFCCGACHSSLTCKCDLGIWQCFYADACGGAELPGGCDYDDGVIEALDPADAPPCPVSDPGSCTARGQQCQFVLSEFDNCDPNDLTSTHGVEGLDCICDGSSYQCNFRFVNEDFCFPPTFGDDDDDDDDDGNFINVFSGDDDDDDDDDGNINVFYGDDDDDDDDGTRIRRDLRTNLRPRDFQDRW